MSHFYANPLSVLSNTDDLNAFLEALQPEHLEAVRMLPSFQRKIENLLDDGMIESARYLLDYDEGIFDEIRLALESKERRLTSLRRTMHIITTVASRTSGPIDRIEYYIKAFSGNFESSEMMTAFLDCIKASPPAELVALIEAIAVAITVGDPGSDLEGWSSAAEEFLEDLSRIQSSIQRLITEAEAAGTNLRNKYSTRDKILRTTVVAQKVQLSKEKSSLTPRDLQYTQLLDEFLDILKEYLKFENPTDLFLHEIWFYDSKSPNREVFTPKPRYAIERALSVPHDYLGCTCCRAASEGLSPSQPPTAILYQLYLETGGLINVFDLWSAFYAIVGGEGEGEDGEDDGDKEGGERRALTLFYRALADLKMLGMVKSSRKKTDHLAKLAWKGL